MARPLAMLLVPYGNGPYADTRAIVGGAICRYSRDSGRCHMPISARPDARARRGACAQRAPTARAMSRRVTDADRRRKLRRPSITVPPTVSATVTVGERPSVSIMSNAVRCALRTRAPGARPRSITLTRLLTFSQKSTLKYDLRVRGARMYDTTDVRPGNV